MLEKLLQALEHCIKGSRKRDASECSECPYEHTPFCTRKLHEDLYKYLKELKC